ncbi:SMI1/KNR4 family protein [Chroococcidiopsis thermalis]|uniref:Cell wall assembly/cell proliferation coordinating protein, KNR4 n=1 Tax=Chroococcidiopsis thermalis (strain PCC 7203) TaxID=251229 RepID=K9TWN9_CHRTP|nr:SMI1/KNR4 family protein [Chroococcidiopsis thermalis]AFY87252.1 Cell wall assembly/cell proliferation coordinating protein, KNR4 [Chroococcidiopsis thermalis PCC 7203]PSB43588.1 molybdenum cofactor biosynthesis protein MoeA [Cyanosarcina cf. burmensis CCALA 770]
MEEIWQRIDLWLQVNAPQIFETLQSGASEAQIAELETILSIKLSEDVKASYRIHNGQSIYKEGLFEGREFLSLNRIRDEWEVWKDLLDSGKFEGYESDPDRGIRNNWWNEKWIPITYDGAGNHDCLDLDPADGGTVGQIMTMYHDSSDRKIVSSSLREWLQKYADELESGRFILQENYGIQPVE